MIRRKGLGVGEVREGAGGRRKRKGKSAEGKGRPG